jgi:hypothetical protein
MGINDYERKLQAEEIARLTPPVEVTYRWGFHLPLNHNDGIPVSSSLIRAIEARLLAVSPYTAFEGDGVWLDQGKIYGDSQRVYFLDTSSDTAGAVLLTIAADVRDMLGQECVYVTRQAIETYLV